MDEATEVTVIENDTATAATNQHVEQCFGVRMLQGHETKWRLEGVPGLAIRSENKSGRLIFGGMKKG